MPWKPPSDPWAPKTVLGCFKIFGAILDPQKSTKMELKFDQTSSADLELSFWPFGGLWGSFGALFWDHFGLHLGLPGASCHFCKHYTAPQREHEFQRFGGSKNEPKMGPKIVSSGNLAPRASGEPPGLDFQAFRAKSRKLPTMSNTPCGKRSMA